MYKYTCFSMGLHGARPSATGASQITHVPSVHCALTNTYMYMHFIILGCFINWSSWGRLTTHWWDYVHKFVSNGVMHTVNPLVCKVSCIISEFKQECIYDVRVEVKKEGVWYDHAKKLKFENVPTLVLLLFLVHTLHLMTMARWHRSL